MCSNTQWHQSWVGACSSTEYCMKVTGRRCGFCSICPEEGKIQTESRQSDTAQHQDSVCVSSPDRLLLILIPTLDVYSASVRPIWSHRDNELQPVWRDQRPRLSVHEENFLSVFKTFIQRVWDSYVGEQPTGTLDSVLNRDSGVILRMQPWGAARINHRKNEQHLVLWSRKQHQIH